MARQHYNRLAASCSGSDGLINSRAALLEWLKTAFREARWAFSLYATIALFLAIRAAGPNDYFDTGLYGAQAVRWLQTFPTVPGLANLHGHLGFNSSAFLCIAVLNRGPWSGLAFHLFTGFLLTAIAFLVLDACLRMARNQATTPADWFHCILAIPVGFSIIRIPIVGTIGRARHHGLSRRCWHDFFARSAAKTKNPAHLWIPASSWSGQACSASRSPSSKPRRYLR